METILSVRGLCKEYEGFALSDVSFELEPGKITGFIGRNGAGKTTTLKSLLNFIHPRSGEIRFFGEEFAGHEMEIKQRIGFATGGVGYYPLKKLKTITQVTRRFYREWDDVAYRRYMELFALDEEKTPKELSEGMKVKYSLALALSHHAELLLLDEPTSGLDPVSREDLLELFLDLAKKEGVSIFFSTHITSDLDKCADRIVYIKNGKILADTELDAFLGQYKLIRMKELPRQEQEKLIGVRQNRQDMSALVCAQDVPIEGAQTMDATLEDIMVHLEKE